MLYAGGLLGYNFTAGVVQYSWSSGNVNATGGNGGAAGAAGTPGTGGAGGTLAGGAG